mgnify:FL=1
MQHSKLTYTSDYFDVIFDYARQLLKNNLAYCDNTDVDTMRKQRKDRIESSCRNQTPEQNL